MLVAVTGFGSLWRRRFDKNQGGPHEFALGVYYNTTGVEVAGTVRQRPKITCYARFHACGGFDPHHPSRAIGQVFECAEPCLWKGNNKLMFQRLLPAPEKPDRFLVVVRPKRNGQLSIGVMDWRSLDTWLIAFSESGAEQEGGNAFDASRWVDTYFVRSLCSRTRSPPAVEGTASTSIAAGEMNPCAIAKEP